MDAYRVYYCSLFLQSLTGPLLATWLWVKAGRQPGMKALALFCLGISFWSSGQLLINLGDEQLGQVGKILLNTGPFNAVLFLHFVLSFLGRLRARLILAGYLIAASLVLAVTWLDMGQLVPWLGFRRYYVFPVWGWIPGVFVVGISTWAYLLLLLAWPAAAPKKRGQILAMCMSGVWGSASTLMFMNPSFGIPIFPYSVILLPFYEVLLVFGVLRYDLMAVNLWANRLLAWLALGLVAIAVAGLLLSLVAQIGITPLANLPLWQLWLQGSVMLFTILALERPIRHGMERFIFPGTHLETGVLAQWRVKLEAAHGWSELETVAGALLSSHLRQTIEVVVAAGPASAAASVASQPSVTSALAAVSTHAAASSTQGPSVRCFRKPGASHADWAAELIGWDGATPSVLRVGEVFGALLAAAATRLDQLLLYAEQENHRLQQAHLLELGGLAATVAHELRNPLNIISMAAVSCPVETRAEIRAQIERADHLIQDLLSYSGDIRLRLEPVNLAQLVHDLVRPHSAVVRIEVAIADDLVLMCDRLRAEQILANLLNNAIAMLRGRPDPQVRIEACRVRSPHVPGAARTSLGAVDARSPDYGLSNHSPTELAAEPMLLVRVCDNGPGIAPDLVKDLFQAFKTRRPGGTGLGLAIVRRLTEAHGGQVRWVAYPGWNCCFELCLPAG